jgi:hypothetical protein
VQTLLQDIRYALRQLRHAPTFTLTALLTLAIGIGATTAIFTLTQAIMLKSLPVADPAQLYRIGDTEECVSRGGGTMTGACSLIPFTSVLRRRHPSSRKPPLFRPRPGSTAFGRKLKTARHVPCGPESAPHEPSPEAASRVLFESLSTVLATAAAARSVSLATPPAQLPA